MLSFDAIRERCRGEHPRDAAERTPPTGAAAEYQVCVVHRLAIWGVG